VVTLDLSTDLIDVADNLEAITVDRRGSSDDTAVTHALQRAVRTRELAASDGRYLTGDVRWHLPKTECGTSPALGDAIEDAAGDRWTVLDVQEATLSTRWGCTCRNLAIVHGLDDVIRIEEATYSKGTGGAQIATWHTWKTGIRARIQEVSATPETDTGARGMARDYEVYLAADVNVNHTHRIVGLDATIYRIRGSRRLDDIEGIQVIEAEQW